MKAIERLADRLDESRGSRSDTELTDALVARGFNRRTAAGAVAEFESNDSGPDLIRDEFGTSPGSCSGRPAILKGEIGFYHGIK